MAYTAIDDPEAYFQVKIYTGTGSSNAITLDGDTDMQPDFVWGKQRNGTNQNHLHDAVRGVTKRLRSDSNDAEDTQAEGLKSFDSDGFTMGTASFVNASDDTYVAWCWKGGTTSGISGSADITPNAYSFNQTSGFSCLTYNGTDVNGDTVLHGLGAVPHLMIVKARTTVTEGWFVYHHKQHATAEDYALRLDTTAATSDNSIWNDTVPTSVLVEFSAGAGVNGGADYIAYCFAEKQGFSKFGIYKGNGNVDGTFVYLGFRPAFIMIKYHLGGGNWYMYDTKRSGAYDLFADTGKAETTAAPIDIVSNGFKIRVLGAVNDANEYIYMAFAEAPFVTSNGVPCNAR